MEQLKVGTNDLPSVMKKKVVAAAASMSSTEAFPTTRLALQLEVPTDDNQYPWLEGGGGVLEHWIGWPARGGGGQYPAGDDGGSHIGEPCNMKV
jgi:hypothetical protein